VGVTFQALAIQSDNELDGKSGAITMNEALDLQNRVRFRQTTAGVAFGIAATAAVVSTALFLLDRNPSAHAAQPLSKRSTRSRSWQLSAGLAGRNVGAVFTSRF
jgi:hypothetical protein